jgi:hypothetical protein
METATGDRNLTARDLERPPDATAERLAIEILGDIADYNGTARRIDLLAKVIGPMVDEYSEIKLRVQDLDDPLAIAGFPGYVLDEDGEAEADVPLDPMQPITSKERRKVKSVRQRLGEIEEGLLHCRSRVSEGTWESALEKVKERKELQ